MARMTLDVWKNGWGLPSVDVECLQVLAYAKFNDIKLNVNLFGNPFLTPNGRLPALDTITSGNLDSAKDILCFFKQEYNLDHTLSKTQCALAMAYDELLREKLYPAMQFIWWIDKANVDQLIRPFYSKTLPFPYNFYYPGKFERQTRALFESLYPTEENINDIENKVYSEARRCLTLLSTRLEDSEYFFGENPTMIDAILYSYLAPLLKIPLPNAGLQNHLKECTNLVNYVTRISKKYFDEEYQEYEQRKTAEENSRKARRDSESDFPNKRRDQFLAGIFVTFAMTAYALRTGIIRKLRRTLAESWIGQSVY